MKSVRFHDSKLKLVKALLFRSFHETEAPTARFFQRLFVEGRIASKEIYVLLHLVLMLCLIGEYLLELLELSQSIWFSFYQYAFYSCVLLRVHLIRTSFIHFY